MRLTVPFKQDDRFLSEAAGYIRLFLFKGTVSRDCFFMILTALVVMIKFSRNWFRFRGEICICKKLLDVINTMESDMFAAMTSG